MAKREIKPAGKSKGFILITSFLLLSVLSIFFLVLSARNSIFLQAAERNQNRIVAFNMAESGLDWALRQLETDSNYRSQTGSSNVTSGYSSKDTNYFQGGYGVQVGPPPNQVNTNYRQIMVVGQAPNDSTLVDFASVSPCPDTDKISRNPTRLPRAYECRAITAFVTVTPPTPFSSAVFAKDTFDINNATIDSYDSRLPGGYDPATAGSNAEIRTNSTAAGAVALTGNALLKGNAVVGPEGNPNVVISLGPNATITGTRTAATESKSFLAPTIPGSATFRDLSNITGDYPIDAGVYYTDSIKISGNGKLRPTTSNGNNKLEIYITGSADVGGKGVVTISNLPTNFVLYATGSDTVKLSGQQNFYGGIYSPNSKVENKGNGDFFGALVAEKYHQTGNGNVHFDEAMKILPVHGAGNSDAKLQSWRELNTAAAGSGS